MKIEAVGSGTRSWYTGKLYYLADVFPGGNGSAATSGGWLIAGQYQIWL